MVFGAYIHSIKLLCIQSEMLNVLKELLPYITKLLVQHFVFGLWDIMQALVAGTQTEKQISINKAMVFFQHHRTFIQDANAWNSKLSADNVLNLFLRHHVLSVQADAVRHYRKVAGVSQGIRLKSSHVFILDLC